jgi:hypothetical protein
MAMQWHEQTLRASGSTPFYSCIQPIRGSAGGAYFHITRGTHIEKSCNKKSIKWRNSVVETPV